MGIAIFCLIFGFTVGYLWRDSRPEKRQKEAPKTKARNIYLSYNERQRAKWCGSRILDHAYKW